jgi:hypothetical protein
VAFRIHEPKEYQQYTNPFFVKGFFVALPLMIYCLQSTGETGGTNVVLQLMVEELNEHLSGHGMITDVILRSDQSLVEEEEQREVIISFAASEEEGAAVASIHLFLPADEESCEVEVEVEYSGGREQAQISHLWAQARGIVPEVSLTEKSRYLEPGKKVESTLLLDYHFVIARPITEEEAGHFTSTLERFASDLGKLVRLG